MAQNMIKQLHFSMELSFLNKIINLTLPIMTTLEQLPLFFLVPRVVITHRFDCIQICYNQNYNYSKMTTMHPSAASLFFIRWTKHLSTFISLMATYFCSRDSRRFCPTLFLLHCLLIACDITIN